MQNFTKIAALIAVICASSSGNALAQSANVNPSWYVGASAIGVHPDTQFGVDHNGTGAGLRFGKALSEYWDMQIGTTYARATKNSDRYQQNLLGGDALFMFSRETIRPFLLIGAGGQRDQVRIKNLLTNVFSETTQTSPYVNAGLGVQIALNDQWSLQADARRVHGFLRDKAFGMNRSDNNYVTIGFNYAFDKPAEPSRPAPVVQAPEPAPVVVAPQPVPAPPPLPPAPRFEKITLSATELFEFNRAELRGQQTKLDEIAAALNADATAQHVTITGYADRIGSSQYNLKLSEKRAIAAKDYLVSKGVDASRLEAQGKGEADPVVTCNNKKRADLIKCLEPNRRIEIEQITIERRVQ